MMRGNRKRNIGEIMISKEQIKLGLKEPRPTRQAW